MSVLSPKPEKLTIEFKRNRELNGKTIFVAISLKGIHLDDSEKNTFFITRNKEIYSFMYATESINGEYKIVCKKINNQLNSFFDVPLNSTELDIYHLENLDYATLNSIIDYDLIDSKMFLIPYPNGYVFVPINNEI